MRLGAALAALLLLPARAASAEVLDGWPCPGCTTVVPPAAFGFLTLWGTDPMPGVSTLNDSDASIVANAALVPAASDGSVSAFSSGVTHLILDINGYFAP